MEIEYFDIHYEDLLGFYSLIPDDLMDFGGYRYLGAIDSDGYACGILVWRLNNGRIDIEHIAVAPDLRRQGIGTGLLDTMMRRLSSAFVFAPVVAVYELDLEHADFDGFIRSIPYFDIVESGRFHIISKEARKASEYCKSLKTKSFSTVSFSQAPILSKRSLYRELEKKGINLFKSQDETELENQLSLCRLSHHEITALILASVNHRDEICVSFVYCKNGYGKDLGACLSEVLKIADKYYPDASIVFDAENEHSVNLSRRLFGDHIKDIPVYTAVSF